MAPATMPMRTPPPVTWLPALEAAVPEGVMAELKLAATELSAADADADALLRAPLTEADADEAAEEAPEAAAEAWEAAADEAAEAAAEADDNTAVLVDTITVLETLWLVTWVTPGVVELPLWARAEPARARVRAAAEVNFILIV
jgi:hypothetical protein